MSYLELIINYIIFALVTEAITEILVDAKITDGFRALIFNKAYPVSQIPKPGPAGWVWFNNLITCGYCTSVWVAMPWALVVPWLYHPPINLATGYSYSDELKGCIVNWMLNVMILHRLSNWLHVLFMLLKKGRIKTYDVAITDNSGGGGNGSSGSTEGTGGLTARPQESVETSRGPDL